MLFRSLIQKVKLWWKSLSSISHQNQSSSDSKPTVPSNTSSSPQQETTDSIKLISGGYVKKFAIIVGHEKLKDGASAGAPLNTSEYPFNKQVAEFMYQYAREKGLDCKIFFRDKIGMSGAAKNVNDWKADCCIELHFNSTSSESVSGTETLYDIGPSDNAEFAEIVQRKMCELFKRKGKSNRGARLLEAGDRGHYNLLAVKVTSCLVEPFFASNKSDRELMWANVTGYSRCLVDAVIEFLNKKETN